MNEPAVELKSYCTIEQNQVLCFDLLTKEEYEILRGKMLVVNYKTNETICKQGAFASHIIIVREGLVKLYMEGASDNLVLQILPPNSIVGLSSCFDGNHIFYYSAQAYMDSTVQLIDMNVFMQVLNANPKFATKMLSFLAEQNIITYGRFFCLTQKQTFGRLADVLLCLANRIYKSPKFPLQLSRKELAELAGMSIESIARIITRFKSENLIEITPDYIEILDHDKLQEISLKG